MNVAFPLLTSAILLAYVIGLWRLLRSEQALSLQVLAVLSAIAVLLRLIGWHAYPGGLNDDEPKVLLGAIKALSSGDLFGEGPTGLPQLIPVLFEAQLVPLIGASRWSIRLYSLVAGILSVPATFAVARAMRLRPISSLAAAAFVVVLPWSLLYGRISQGGELLFNQLLLLAALARLVWRDGTWREVPIGALGLGLLFYDYFSGRSMLAMPFVAAVLARGSKRLWCVAIAALGVLAFLPQAMSGHQYALVGLSMVEVHPSYAADPLGTLAAKLFNSLLALTTACAANAWMTVSSAAMHPWLILALAVVGLFTGVRRGLFLAAGFVAGLMPNAVAHGDLWPSAHRMHAAFIFIPLAAGASFDLVPWRSLRAVVAGGAVAFVAFWSLTFYFSPAFWRAEAEWMFSNSATDVVESIPWGQPRVVEANLGDFIAIRTDLHPKRFGVEHLALPGPALYVFGSQLAALQPFYRGILWQGSVQPFDEAFSIKTGESDGAQLLTHGWWYEVTCGTNVRTAQIPVLFHYNYSFSDFGCGGPARHVWRGIWGGPASDLRLWHSGSATVETVPGGTVTGEPGKPSLDFKVSPEAKITVRISGSSSILATLFVVTPRQERLPYLEWVDPVMR